MISSYPQSYVQQSAGGRSFPPSLTGLAGGGNPNASPGPGDLYADGSLPGYTAAAVAAAAAAAAAAGSPQTGSIAALARVRKYFTLFFFLKERIGGGNLFFYYYYLLPIPEDIERIDERDDQRGRTPVE